MTQRQYVVFDIDGVLADFPFSYSRLAATMYNVKPLETETQRTFKLIDGQLSDAEALHVWEKVERSPTFWLNILSLTSPEDASAMHTLYRAGADFIYLSNRHDTATTLRQTQLWLVAHGFPAGRVILSKNKDAFLRDALLESKRPVMRLSGRTEENPGRLLGIIEDAPKNLEAYAKGIATWYWRPVVFVADREYNREATPDLPRVSSVEDFCNRMLLCLENPPLWTEEKQVD